MKPVEFLSLPEDVRERLLEIGVDFPVFYVGKQWAVTAYGIEQISDPAVLNPYYNIEADRLRQSMGNGGWVDHMSEKTWVDADEFAAVYSIALAVHTIADTEKWRLSESAPKSGEMFAIKAPFEQWAPKRLIWVSWMECWSDGETCYDSDEFTHWAPMDS